MELGTQTNIVAEILHTHIAKPVLRNMHTCRYSIRCLIFVAKQPQLVFTRHSTAHLLADMKTEMQIWVCAGKWFRKSLFSIHTTLVCLMWALMWAISTQCVIRWDLYCHFNSRTLCFSTSMFAIYVSYIVLCVCVLYALRIFPFHALVNSSQLSDILTWF